MSYQLVQWLAQLHANIVGTGLQGRFEEIRPLSKSIIHWATSSSKKITNSTGTNYPSAIPITALLLSTRLVRRFVIAIVGSLKIIAENCRKSTRYNITSDNLSRTSTEVCDTIRGKFLRIFEYNLYIACKSLRYGVLHNLRGVVL